MGGQQSKTTKGRGDAAGDLFEDQLISINIKKKRKNPHHGTVRGKVRGGEAAATSSLSIDSALNTHTNIQSTQKTLRNSNNQSCYNDNDNNSILRWDKLVDGTISTPAFDKNKTCEETVSLGSRNCNKININSLHHREKLLSKFPRRIDKGDGGHENRDEMNLELVSLPTDGGSLSSDEKENKIIGEQEQQQQQSEFIIPPPKIRLQILSPVHSRHQNQHHGQHNHYSHHTHESQMSISNSQQLYGKGDMKVTVKKKEYHPITNTSNNKHEMNLSNRYPTTEMSSSSHQKKKVTIHIMDSNTNVSSQDSCGSEMRQTQNPTFCNSSNTKRNYDSDKNAYNISNTNENNSSSQSKKLIPIYCSPRMIKHTFSDESESVMSHPRYHTKPLTNTAPISKTSYPINPNNHYNLHSNHNTTTASTNSNNNNIHTSRNSSRNGPVHKTATAPNPRITHSVVPTTRETVSTAASKRKLKVRGLKNFVDSHRPCPPLWSKQFPCRSKFHPDNYLYDFEGWNAPKRPVRAMEKCPKKCGRCNRCGVYTDNVCKKCNNCTQDCKCGNFRRLQPNPSNNNNTTTMGSPQPPTLPNPGGGGVQSINQFAPTAEHFVSQLFGPNWSQSQKIQVNNVPVEPDKPKLNLHIASSNNPLKIKNSKPALATGYDTYTPAAVNTDQQQQQQIPPQHYPAYGYPYPTYPTYPYPYSMPYVPAPNSLPYYGYATPPPPPLNYC